MLDSKCRTVIYPHVNKQEYSSKWILYSSKNEILLLKELRTGQAHTFTATRNTH